MYQILLNKDNAWQQYKVTVNETVPVTVSIGNQTVSSETKSQKVSKVFDAATLEELQEEYSKLLKLYPAQKIMPVKSMDVVNNSTITESTN